MAKTIRSSGHEALRDALIAARKNAGLTQEQLATRLKCHQSFVARVESGERAMEVETAKLLAVAERETDADHRI